MNDHPARSPTSRFWKLGCAACLCMMAGCSVWLGFAIRDLRENARASQCIGRPKQLALAFHNYHEAYGCFPPAFVADADGKPMHSWRVLILPFVDQEAAYRQYDFSQPWNSPHNKKLEAEVTLSFLQCPSQRVGNSHFHTNYVVVTGEGTVFPTSGRSTSLKDVQDGLESTILLVEVAGTGIHWMEPRDLKVEEMSRVINDPDHPSISSAHPAGPGVAFVDGSVLRLTSSLRPETVQAMLTIHGDEPVSRKAMERWDSWTGRQLTE